MQATKSETVRIGYQKHWFTLGTVVYICVTVALFYFSASAVEGSTRMFWLAAGVVEGILFFMFMVPPLFTSHLAGDKGLRLHMGLLINETILYDWIKEIKETSVHWGAVRVGIGVRYSALTRALFVTSAFDNLVVIRLNQEHKMGRILRRPVSEIVVSVSYANGFMDTVSKRAGFEREV